MKWKASYGQQWCAAAGPSGRSANWAGGAGSAASPWGSPLLVFTRVVSWWAKERAVRLFYLVFIFFLQRNSLWVLHPVFSPQVCNGLVWGASIPTALLKEPEATAALSWSTGVGAIPWDPLASKGLLRQLCLSLGQKVSEMIKDPAQRFLGKKSCRKLACSAEGRGHHLWGRGGSGAAFLAAWRWKQEDLGLGITGLWPSPEQKHEN